MQSSWQIVIAERGWVYVGQWTREGDRIVSTNAYNIRRWGTHALGGLAQHAPREGDTLDFFGTVRVGVFVVLGEIDCDDTAWQKWHAKQEKARK